jgi:hypothetical protein
MRFSIPFEPPRHRSVYGSAQPGPGSGQPDPVPPAAPGGPPPVSPPPLKPDPGPAEPFPYEPGDIPVPAPQPEPEAPKEPEKVAATSRFLTATEEFNEFLLAENLRLSKANHRLELATIAGLLAAAPTLNYLISAVSRLEPEDWRHCRDLAETLHRQTVELSGKLAPLCRSDKPKLAIVS